MISRLDGRNLGDVFYDPVVTAGLPTHQGGDPGVVRVRNGAGSAFDIRIQE